MTQHFATLWDGAGEEAQALESQRRMEQARVASAELGGFLVTASTEADFSSRVSLVELDLAKAANAAGVTVEALALDYAEQNRVFRDAQRTAAAHQCACGHASVHHADGGRCPTCGCAEFRPVAQAAKDPNAYLDNQCPGCGKPGSHPFPENTCASCQGESAAYQNSRSDEDTWDPRSPYSPPEPDERTSYERYSDAGPSYRDPGDMQDDWYGRHALLKKALEEGVDPLSLIEGLGGGVGTPEKAGGHQSTGDATEGPSAGQQVEAAKRPF